MSEYLEFLKTKQKQVVDSGFEVDESELNSLLKPFQKYIVIRALKSGKFAIFSDTGTGKTFMQLEWANQVSKYTRKPVLVLAPLAVSGQTIEEGKKFNISVVKYGFDSSSLSITNYEQLANINARNAVEQKGQLSWI